MHELSKSDHHSLGILQEIQGAFSCWLRMVHEWKTVQLSHQASSWYVEQVGRNWLFFDLVIKQTCAPSWLCTELILQNRGRREQKDEKSSEDLPYTTSTTCCQWEASPAGVEIAPQKTDSLGLLKTNKLF